jgi:hypothetical protein
MTYRQIDRALYNQDNIEEIIKTKDERYRQKYVNQRTIVVRFIQDSGISDHDFKVLV